MIILLRSNYVFLMFIYCPEREERAVKMATCHLYRLVWTIRASILSNKDYEW